MEAFIPVLVESMTTLLDVVPRDTLVAEPRPHPRRQPRPGPARHRRGVPRGRVVQRRRGQRHARRPDQRRAVRAACSAPCPTCASTPTASPCDWWTAGTLAADAELRDATSARLVTVPGREVRGYRGDLSEAATDLAAHVRDGWRLVAVTEGHGPAQHLVQVLTKADVPARLSDSLDAPPEPGVVHVTTAGVLHGFVSEPLRLALLTETDLAGQRTSTKDMRKMPSKRRQAVDPLTLKPGDHVVHETHGIGRFVEMTQRVVQGATREYLVLEYAPSKRNQPGDRVYVPYRRPRPREPLRRRRDPGAVEDGRLGLGQGQGPRPQGRQADRRRARPAVQRADGEHRPRVRPRHRVAARARGRLPLRRDARPAREHRRGQGRHGEVGPHGPADLRRRRLRQDRDRPARGVQGRHGRQAGRGPRAHHPAGPAAPVDVLRAVRRLPGRRPGAVAVLQRRRGPQRPRGRRRRQRRRRHRHPPPARQGHAVQGPRPRRHRRGAALRRRAQGAAEEAAHQRRRARDVRDAHPAHPGDGRHRHPRDVDAGHPAGGAPPDPHLRRPVRRAPGRRRHPPRAAARGAGVLRPQPGERHRADRGAPRLPGPRGPDPGRPRADGGGRPRADRRRLLGAPLRRPRLHDDRRDRPRHRQRQHPHRRPGRHVRAVPAAPAARPGRSRPRARLRVLHVEPGRDAHRHRPRPARRPSPRTPSSARACRSP